MQAVWDEGPKFPENQKDFLVRFVSLQNEQNLRYKISDIRYQTLDLWLQVYLKKTRFSRNREAWGGSAFRIAKKSMKPQMQAVWDEGPKFPENQKDFLVRFVSLQNEQNFRLCKWDIRSTKQ